MVVRRGDNIPPISDYAHWNEDAERMWYEENRMDMLYWDEPIEDDYDYNPSALEMYFEANVDDQVWEFNTEEEARKFYEEISVNAYSMSLRSPSYDNKWRVEGMTAEYYQAAIDRFNYWQQNKRKEYG